ncbi:MAG: HEAT repeat domain-containing protein [Planctomycetota bacterium]
MPNSAETQLADSHPNHDAGPTSACRARSRSRLYVLPAFIVLAITLGSLLLLRTLRQEPNPRDLARGLQQPGRRGWQSAYALSQLLLAPEHDHLKDDARLCRALTATLARQNEKARQATAANEAPDEELIQFRAFLCHVLGQFRVVDGLPVLLECVQAETDGRPSSRRPARVRRAAIEAIALLAANTGPENVRAEPDVIPALVAAAVAHDASLATTPASTTPERDIPSAATFALGVIGGRRATAQLIELLEDIRPDVRYNAATGLARRGRPEAMSVVLQMLDPTSRVAWRDERTESARARKRLIVRSNGIAAAARLIPVAADDDQNKLIAALEQLRDSQTAEPRIRVAAKETLLKLAPPSR